MKNTQDISQGTVKCTICKKEINFKNCMMIFEDFRRLELDTYDSIGRDDTSSSSLSSNPMLNPKSAAPKRPASNKLQRVGQTLV
jgi:hypothetical protein